MSWRCLQSFIITFVIYTSLGSLIVRERDAIVRAMAAGIFAAHLVKDTYFPLHPWGFTDDLIAILFAGSILHVTCHDTHRLVAILMILGHLRHILYGGTRFYELA